jgi:hypothetical protein
MKLTPDQNSKLLSFIQSKWKPPYVCSCCASNSWNIGQELFQLTQFAGGAMIVGGPLVPVAPLICTNCGNTVLVNAIVAGIVDPNATQEAPKDGK